MWANAHMMAALLNTGGALRLVDDHYWSVVQ